MESLADMEERKRTGQYQQRRYLLRNDAGEVVKELPIPSHPNGATWFRYVEFKDSYFGYLWQPDRNRMGLHSTIAGEDWKRLGCLKGYWLDRQGNVEEACIPYGPWGPDCNVFVYPVKDGYVIIKKELERDSMYYTTEKVYRKLLEGEFSDISVSPDGSRIAFGHGPPLPVHMRQQKPFRPYKAPHVTFTSLKSIDLSRLDRNQFNPLPEVNHAD